MPQRRACWVSIFVLFSANGIGAHAEPSEGDPEFIPPPSGGHDISNTPCALWSKRLFPSVLTDFSCWPNQPIPYADGSGVVGCTQRCGSLDTNTLQAKAIIDTSCNGGGSAYASAGANFDTELVFATGERRLVVRYTPPSGGGGSNVKAKLYASGRSDLSITLDYGSAGYSTSVSAGCSSKLTFSTAFSLVELDHALEANPPLFDWLSGQLSDAGSQVSIGGQLGFPEGGVEGNWEMPQGGTRAVGSRSAVWVLNTSVCVQPPSVPAGASYVDTTTILGGVVTARSAIVNGGLAKSIARLELRDLQFSFPDGCEDCAVQSEPGGPGQTGG